MQAAGEGFALETSRAKRAGRAHALLAVACVSPAVTALIAGALVTGAARMIAVARHPARVC